MQFKVYLNLLLCRLGIRNILPKDIVAAIQIIETDEPLINFFKLSPKLFFASNLSPQEIRLRSTVVAKLQHALELLPNNVCFKVYETYRSIEKQKELWETEVNKTKTQNLEISEDEITRLTRQKVADPRRGFGGHQTGAAIDIALCDSQGMDLDMGGKYLEFDANTKTKSKTIIATARRNRKLLVKVLEQVGFKNYPAEWWHFSYGDQLWAAYANKKNCPYGVVTKEANNLTVITNRLVLRELVIDDIPRLSNIALTAAKKSTEELLENYKSTTDCAKYEQKISKYFGKRINITNIPDSDLFASFGPLQYPFNESSRAFVTKAIQKQHEDHRRSYIMGICLKNNIKNLIGIYGMSSLIYKDVTNNIKKTGYICYLMDPSYQNQGFSSEANRAMLKLLYQYLLPKEENYHEDVLLYATCHPCNKASIRMQGKFGGKLFGETIKSYGNRLEFYYHKNDLLASPGMSKPGIWTAFLGDECLTDL